MKRILRIILASLAGVIATMLTLSTCESILPMVVEHPPMPSDLNGDWSGFAAQLSVTYLLGLLAGYALAGFVGGYVATWASPKPRKATAASVTAVAYAISGILNFQMIPHPVWMMVAAMAAYIGMPIAGYFARR